MRRFMSVIIPVRGAVTKVPTPSLRAKRSNLIFIQAIAIEIASSTDLSVGTPRNDDSRVFQQFRKRESILIA